MFTNSSIFEIKEKIKKKSSVTTDSSVLRKKDIDSKILISNSKISNKLTPLSDKRTLNNQKSLDNNKEEIYIPKTHQSPSDFFSETNKDLFCRKTKKRKTKW